MARTTMMARGVVSILLAIVLLAVFFTGLEGDEGDDEGGAIGGGHTTLAYLLILLLLVHFVLNFKMFRCEIRSFLEHEDECEK